MFESIICAAVLLGLIVALYVGIGALIVLVALTVKDALDERK